MEKDCIDGESGCKVLKEENREPTKIECVCCSTGNVLDFSSKLMELVLDNRDDIQGIKLDVIREDFQNAIMQYAKAMIRAEYKAEGAQKMIDEIKKSKEKRRASGNPLVF
jgi:hypothetical protein